MLIEKGYITKLERSDNHIYISSRTKKSRGKRYYVCENDVFSYYYENGIETEHEYYPSYYKQRKREEEKALREEAKIAREEALRLKNKK